MKLFLYKYNKIKKFYDFEILIFFYIIKIILKNIFSDDYIEIFKNKTYIINYEFYEKF